MKWVNAKCTRSSPTSPRRLAEIVTPGVARLLAGLRTYRLCRSQTAFLVAHLPGSEKTSDNWTFDPVYRCGAVPDSHRVPFRRSP
jgi:hypothetical protein